jgi:hypothetical protein
MRSSWFSILAAVSLLACGGGDEPPVQSEAPIIVDGRTVTGPPGAHGADDGHDHAGHGHDDGAKAKDQPSWVGGPGTLTVAYSNNVDGEIEPCG